MRKCLKGDLIVALFYSLYLPLQGSTGKENRQGVSIVILPILEKTVSDTEQYICEYGSAERDVDAIIFSIEKAHNEHPADFQSLIECLKMKGRRRSTKKRRDNGEGNLPWIEAVWTELCPSTYS